MQREILFRAKYQQSEDVNDLKWVYGHLCLDSHLYRSSLPAIQTVPNPYEISQSKILYTIHHPETIGQFIGCNDINGNKIFEGDILRDENGNTGFVVFINGSFEIEQITGIQSDWYNSFYDPDGRSFSWNELEIIGNIHDKKDKQ